MAQDLLRHERNAGDRVMALLALHQWGPAVLAAELAHDCDLGAIVAIRLREAELAGELAGEEAAKLLAGNDHVLREYLRLAGNETTGKVGVSRGCDLERARRRCGKWREKWRETKRR